MYQTLRNYCASCQWAGYIPVAQCPACGHNFTSATPFVAQEKKSMIALGMSEATSIHSTRLTLTPDMLEQIRAVVRQELAALKGPADTSTNIENGRFLIDRITGEPMEC